MSRPTLLWSSFTLPCTPFQPISAQRGQQIEVTNKFAGGLPKSRDSLNYSTTIVVRVVVAGVIVVTIVRGGTVMITIPLER